MALRPPLAAALGLLLACPAAAFSPAARWPRRLTPRASTEAPFADVLAQVGDSNAAQAGASALEGLAMPTRKQEAYRFSKVPDLFKKGGYRLAEAPELSGGAVQELEALLSDVPKGHRVVTINGVWSADWSDISAVAASVGGLESADDEAKAMLGQISEKDGNPRMGQGTAPLMALSLAVATDATIVRVTKDTADETPLYVLHVLAGEGAERSLSSPRLVVVAEEGARLRLVEHFVTIGEGGGSSSLVNAVAKMVLKADSYVEHMFLQEMAATDSIVASTNVTVGDRAVYNGTSINAGASASRVNIQVDLNGVGGRGETVGLQLTGPKQTQETYVSMVHNGEDCVSDEQQRNVVAKAGEAVFKGRIHIGAHAAGTDSNQLVKTLLLEDGARITALPTLEVINENVEAAHGATVSDLDEESVFYLRSRGLSAIQARRVLMKGFVDKFLPRVEVPGSADRMRSKLEAMVPQEGASTKKFYQSV